ncbi:hypothetical protein B9Q02_06010 [Candidatus Marsarchaeota G1 archaeon BE_D]|uniref:DHHA1 domain-containing protein n=2 Tax=Candidatus Marsarchaeota group 1 TaxID=2203770 RepID=A0A2R6AGS5_9ARCH|nr:MAG: hypothetical protein B9Q02_06010 [Candidatus Marsarchaeota G1 archaeon BE_D]PSN87135.1 MAG: hypothetical protein B9Q00_09665 [Candidatus Marsarchaeota G1 archaeon OSP_C]
MANVIFSHRRDVDGLMSAAIFLRRFRDAKLNFVDYGKENVEELIKKLYALSQGDFVVIADFGLDDDYAKRLSDVLSELTKKERSFTGSTITTGQNNQFHSLSKLVYTS